jgi:hypothetical protein
MEIGESALQFHALKRRLFQILLFLFIFAAAIFAEAKAFANGDPLLLSGIVRDDDGGITLVAGATYEAGSTSESTYFGDFDAIFNGMNATISGLLVPLFNSIGDGGVVKNLHLETFADETGVQGKGALANALESGGKVENVTVTGNVTGGIEVGGLVGSSSGTITNSSMNGEVNGDYRVGGLVGVLNTGGTITGSQATGDVTGIGDRVGGLVGWADGNISSSSAEGNVSGRWDVGGLVGYSSGDIANSHATGDVSGEDRVGGLVGQSDGDITFSSAKGEVTSTAVNAVGDGIHGPLALDGRHGIGGLVGYNTGDITSSFTGEADTDSPIPAGAVTGLKNVGGLVGFSSGNISNSRASGNVNESWSCADNSDEPVCIDYVGGLVGYSTGDIESSWASGTVTGLNYIGGLVGYSTGDIESTFAEGEAYGTNYVGGLVGYSTGDITVSEASGGVGGQSYTGGLVGYSVGDITDSNATINVYGFTYSGGLVGYSEGNITNSHSTGEEVVSASQGGGGDFIGGLVGYSEGEITGSSATADVTGRHYVGGLVGKSEGNITNSWASSYVSGDHYVGGLVGYSEGDISDSSATGDIEFPEDETSWIPKIVIGGDYVGGLVGYSVGDVINSNAAIVVLGSNNIGGLVGKSLGKISDSHATGIVESIGEYVGGLVGYSEGDITDSSASGDVTGDNGMTGPTDYIGGLVGYLEGVIKNSFATGSVSGGDNVGGLVGSIDTLPWLDPYLDLSTLRSSRPIPDIGEINLVQGDFYIWDGEDWRKIYNISGSYAEGNVTGGSYVGGLVGSSSSETTITDSYATGVVIGDGEYIGGFIGDAGYNSKISNSYATGSVTGTNDAEHGVGGFAGYLSGSLINTYATGNVNGFDEVGGLVGSTGVAVSVSISNSHATGNVTGVDYIGGLVGELDYNHTITNSYATGDASGNEWVGGLVGQSDGDITNSHAKGRVNGEEHVGGLVGYAAGDITDSYAEGAVSGTYDNVGGLAGTSIGNITDSHAIGTVTGSYDVGGLVGRFYENREITYSYVDLGTLLLMTRIFNDPSEEGPPVEPGSNAVIAGQIYFYPYPSGETPSDWIPLRDVVTITNSYAKGNVTGADDIGGLVGNLGDWARITNSYATGNVIGKVEDEGGDAGGLVGFSSGVISNSHASGDVSGFYDIGGLVGDLQGTIFVTGDLKGTGSITNSYATGNVTATGTDGGWIDGWGGLVGESSGLISNSYATGNVVADYNFGSLIGYLMLNENLDFQILNSFATGSTSRANNVVRIYETVYDADSDPYVEVELDLLGLGGFVGCAVEDGSDGYICIDSYKSFPETTPSLLSVVNTEGTAGAPAFEIVACKNNGLPLLSELSVSYGNTCPVSTNRERRIREFIQTTTLTQIAKTLGFVISPKFPNDAQIGFIENEKELAISKILGVQKAADRVARTFVKTGEALQISYDSGSKEPIELWVKLPNGKWLLAGVINFDKDGKAILPPMYFKVAGEHVLVLNKPSEDSVKANTPLNQIGSLTVIVN